MRISGMPIKTVPSGAETVPIFDPNEPIVGLRNKRVLLSTVMGGQGPQGLSAYEVWIEAGNSGTEQDFFNDITGETGPSIYQVWLDDGNVGTVDDFLLTLKGSDGSVFYNADGEPTSGVGVERDYYIDNNTGILYYRGPSGWGATSIVMKGSAGSIWHTDPGAPNPATGDSRDFFLDNSTGDVYGPKLFGDWGSPVINLKGPAGVSWYSSTGAPDNGDGNDSDYYIDLITGEVYGPKTAGDWGSPVGNLKGPQGVQGASILLGSGAPDVGDGSDGDYYIDITTGELYGPKLPGDWGTSQITLLQNLQSVLGFGASSDIPIEITYDDSGDTGNTTLHGDYVEFKHNDGGGDSTTRLYGQTGLAGITADVLLPGYSGTLITQDDLDNAVAALPKFFQYVGEWDPSTNTPPLANTDTGVQGNVYRATETAAHDFGDGPIEFNDGDFAINNGTKWDKWDVTDTVVSVNGHEGVVVLDTDDIDEGVTNLYFTDERAQDAVGNILVDNAWFNWTYDDGTPSIELELNDLSIGNEKLTNSSITIAGTEVDLGDSVDLDTLLGVITNGIIKRTGANTYAVAVAGTDYASPTNGSDGEILTSDGAGGFGTPLVSGVDLAPLVLGKVPAGYLPSFVDDVVEVDTYGDLPVTGESDKIYVVLDGETVEPDNKSYRWSGSVYVPIVASPGSTDNVPEGSINEYFTPARARTAVVVQTITDGDTDHSPSGDAVFDALALKANIASLAASATTDTTNANNITTGTLNKNRGGAGDVSGILKADGLGVVSAAVAGTDYAEATSGSSILKGDGAGGFDPAVAGTDYAPATTGTDILKGDGAGGFAAADPGVDYVIPSQLIDAIMLYDGDDSEVVALGVLRSFRLPTDFDTVRFKANLKTAQATGNLVTIDVKKNGVTVFTTQLTIDNTALTSVGATTPAVISVSNWDDDDLLEVEVTDVGDGTAEGLQVWMVGYHKP